MKIIKWLVLLLCSTSLLYADNITPTAQPSTPTAQATNDISQTVQNTNVSASMATKIVYDLKSTFQEDGWGNKYTSELGIKAKQTLFNNFTAESYIRFVKPFSNSNTPVDIN
jgi:hypothetical protein